MLIIPILKLKHLQTYLVSLAIIGPCHYGASGARILAKCFTFWCWKWLPSYSKRLFTKQALSFTKI